MLVSVFLTVLLTLLKPTSPSVFSYVRLARRWWYWQLAAAARTLENNPGRSPVLVSSSSSAAAATVAIAAAVSACARLTRGQVASPEPRSSSSRARSSTSLSSEREHQAPQLQSAHSFASQVHGNVDSVAVRAVWALKKTAGRATLCVLRITKPGIECTIAVH